MKKCRTRLSGAPSPNETDDAPQLTHSASPRKKAELSVARSTQPVADTESKAYQTSCFSGQAISSLRSSPEKSGRVLHVFSYNRQQLPHRGYPDIVMRANKRKRVGTRHTKK
jgi:hypothetical protein